MEPAPCVVTAGVLSRSLGNQPGSGARAKAMASHGADGAVARDRSPREEEPQLARKCLRHQLNKPFNEVSLRVTCACQKCSSR